MLSLLTLPRRTVLEPRVRPAGEPEEAYGIIIRPGPVPPPGGEPRPRMVPRAAGEGTA